MRKAFVLLTAMGFAAPAMAQDIGTIKVSRGSVEVRRGAEKLPGKVGTALRSADVLVTGADGSAGVTFSDNSLVSIGPASVFSIDRYRFDGTTHVGEFEGSLRQGRLAAVSGKMVKQSPESMKIRTPSAVMGVRGTEFLVEVDAPKAD